MGGHRLRAIRFRELRLSQVVPCLLNGPVGLVIGLLMLVEMLGFPGPVLWKRPK